MGHIARWILALGSVYLAMLMGYELANGHAHVDAILWNPGWVGYLLFGLAQHGKLDGRGLVDLLLDTKYLVVPVSMTLLIFASRLIGPLTKTRFFSVILYFPILFVFYLPIQFGSLAYFSRCSSILDTVEFTCISVQSLTQFIGSFRFLAAIQYASSTESVGSYTEWALNTLVPGTGSGLDHWLNMHQVGVAVATLTFDYLICSVVATAISLYLVAWASGKNPDEY